MAAACRDWAARFDWARSAARMSALVDAAIARGTASSARPEALVVRRDGAEQVVEGPVRDALLDEGAEPVREATAVERLLGWAGGWPR
jgi:hypothetical protein